MTTTSAISLGENETSSFNTAFMDLAYHLYPDGCPDIDLKDDWPSKANRANVPFNDALLSIQAVQSYSIQHRITEKQGSAVLLAAIRIVQGYWRHKFCKPKKLTSRDDEPLLDGSSQYFCTLVRCVLPRNNPGESVDDKIFPSFNSIICLLSVASASNYIVSCCILQFVTLVFDRILVRLTSSSDPSFEQPMTMDCQLNLNVGYSHKLKNFISLVFKLVFPLVTRTPTCADAVRLVLTLLSSRPIHTTGLVTIQRAVQLREFYTICCRQQISLQASKSKTYKRDRWSRKLLTELGAVVTVIPILMQYFVAINKKCFKYSLLPYSPLSKSQILAEFPDLQWKTKFFQDIDTTKRSDDAKSIKRLKMDPTITDPHGYLKSGQDILDYDDALSQLARTKIRKYCDIVGNLQYRHSMLLSGGSLRKIFKDRSDFDFKLLEEFSYIKQRGRKAPSEINRLDPSKHQPDAAVPLHIREMQHMFVSHRKLKDSLVGVLATLCLHTAILPPSAENFLINILLPLCDVNELLTNDLSLYHEVLPSIKPRSFKKLKASGILSQLNRMFIYSNERTQYAIISGFFATLICRWGCLDWCKFGVCSKNDQSNFKLKTLRELIKWGDSLIIKGFLSNYNQSHELFNQATIEFLKALQRLSEQCKIQFITPSLSILVYRLFLSASANQVDQVCSYLINLDNSMKNARVDAIRNGNTVVSTLGQEHINLLNCFIWDLYTLLWKYTCIVVQNSEQTANGCEDEKELPKHKSIFYTYMQPDTRLCLDRCNKELTCTLSINNNPAFSGFGLNHCKTVNSSSCTPTSSISIHEDLHQIEFLKKYGLKGVHLFLSSFHEKF